MLEYLLLSLCLASATSAATIGNRATTSSSSAVAAAASSSCACGYKDSNGHIWRESVISNFSGSSAMTVLNHDYGAMTWGVNRTYSYMQNNASNVYSYNNYLGIKTNTYHGNVSNSSAPIQVGEIMSKRSDILYGSFRMLASIPTTPGVCFGFFAYYSDYQETDIEFLTSDSNYYQTAHYTNQPHGVALSQQKTTLSGDLRTPGVHRFDWLTNTTQFYYNDQKYSSISVNVANTSSHIIANVWSDGDPTWTKGPPTADAIATIQYIHMYFNSTSLNDATFQKNCVAAGKPAVCSV